MQPPLPSSSQPSRSNPRSTNRQASTRAPHRPDRYEVAHCPRRVIVAGARSEYSAPNNVPLPAKNPRKNNSPKKSLPKKNFQKKIRRLRFGPWEWIGLGVSVLACGLLVGEIASAQSDHQTLRVAVREKTAQRDALDKQLSEDSKKLAYLKSEKGREQILAERGYLKPGDRILLFPADPKPDSETAGD